MYIILPSLDLSTALLVGTNSVSGPGPRNDIGAPQFYNTIQMKSGESFSPVTKNQTSMHLVLFEEVEGP